MNSYGKRILSMLCAIVMVFSMIAGVEFVLLAEAATEGMSLAGVQIVVPASATSVERTAATELQNYLFKITGVQSAVTEEGKQQSGPAIYLGNTARARLVGVSYPKDGDENGEAWAIQQSGERLFLVGAPTRGPLYAVYHLLEDVFGVHWWNMWEEEVPKGDAVVPTDYASSGIPVMENRGAFYGLEGNAQYTYFVRNRMNSNLGSIPASYGGAEEYGYPAHVHTFNRYFTGDDFSAHPEWFSQVSGSRVSDGQLCLTNSGLIAEFSKRLVNAVASNPDFIYSVSPNDNTKFCECSNCKSAINTYGYSGYVLNFVNQMASDVKAAGYKNAKVEMLVYWAYIEAPKGGVVPADNVTIRFADNYIDLLHGLDHANNADTLANVQSWLNISGNDVYYWQYVVNYNNNGVLPTMFYYGEDMVTLMQMGVNGWFAEQEQCINADFWDMKLWLIAKLMENPVSGDEYAALMDEFIYGYYGKEAGKHIRDYLYFMNDKAEASDVNVTFSSNIITAQWLTVQDIIKGNDYFEQAFAAAYGNETLLRRLRAARSGLDRVIHDNFVSWSNKAAAAGLSLPFTLREVGERIYQTMTEQIQMRGSYDPDYPQFYSSYENKYSESQKALPSELSGYAREHILDYTVEDFRIANAGTIVNDSDSVTGQAYCLDTSGMSTANSTQRAIMKAISINAYDPSGTTNNGIRTIGSISAKNLTRNGGYKLYAIDWTVPNLGNDTNDYVYIFDDWGLQIPTMKQDLNSLVGKTVKIYISVKAIGSLSISTYFKGKYYIDRVVVLPTPSQTTHNYTTTPSTYGNTCRSVCSACGDVVLSAHSWNDGVVSKAPTITDEGEMLYTCTLCGGTKTEAIEKLKGVIDSIHEGHRVIRDYSAFNTAPAEGTNYVDDAEAYGGKAVCYSKSTLDDSSFIAVYRYDVASGLTDPELRIGGLLRNDLAINDGYHVYKFTYTVPEATTAGNVFYIMNNWQLNSSVFCADFADFAGQTVNVYLSIKVTGPDANGYYSIFVDRVALESMCADYMQNGVCSVCGNEDKLLKLIPDAHLAVMRDYTAFPENAALKTSYVADPDAYNGMAVCHIENNVNISVTRYDSGREQKIGTLTRDALKIGEGYQIHKFAFDVPANSTKGNYLFIMSSWQFQSIQLCYDLADYAGQSVELYISMKVTGPDSNGNYALYIDRVAIATVCKYQENETGVACSICGKKDPLYNLVNKDHLVSIRDYSTFATDANEGTVYVEDSEAFGGKAVCHTTNNPKMSINRYDVASGLSDGHASLRIGVLEKDDLKIDMGYYIYKFTYAVPETTTRGNTFYIMPNWQLNNATFCADFAAYAGKTVAVYLSIKVTTNANGTYSIYVDRVVLESYCEDHIDSNGICTVCGKVMEGLHTHSWGYAYADQDQHTCTCTTCGAQVMENHSWDDGAVTQQPTWNEEGVKTYTCAVCKGTKTEAIEKLPVPVSTWNLVLGDNIGINFVMNVSETNVIAVTVNGEAVETQMVDGTVSVELAAAQMNDVIAISVNGVALPNTYSVRAYADYILDEANGYDDATKNLVKAMLVYGGASQTCFNYNTEALASDGISIDAAAVPADGGSFAIDGTDAKATFYGASLVYRNKIAVRFYFTGSSEGVDGAVEKDGMFYIEVADINPQALADGITVTVGDLSVTYSPIDYMIRMNNKADTSADTKALVQALYNYYLAAVNYTAQ